MADDYTPTEARVRVDFCNAATKRPKPDGSVMTMGEADAAFTRFLAEKRAEWEAEQGEPAVSELRAARAETWDEAIATVFAWWSAPESERPALIVNPYGTGLPVPDTTNHETTGENDV